MYGRSSGQAHGEYLEARRVADVKRPDPNAVGMNEGDAASTLFGRCAAVLVDDLVAGWSLTVSGASDMTHVSVRASTSSFRSEMVSWISAASWTADRAFNRPSETPVLADEVRAGPGLLSTPPSSGNSNEAGGR